MTASVESRAARYAALGDPTRLEIVDQLMLSDRSPLELRRLIGIESNLLAHHLDVLESVGVISRSRSSGDGRRRYVHAVRPSFQQLTSVRTVRPGRALFVCTRNSARSQLAAALWRSMTQRPAESAGTRPADHVHPEAIAAAKRAGVDLTDARPRALNSLGKLPGLVVTVCDQAHEELSVHDRWLHWSIPDPVSEGSRAAFDSTVVQLRDRISAFVGDQAAS